MKPNFIPLGISKFQICCTEDCEADAVGEHIIQNNGHGTFYLGYCKEHKDSITRLEKPKGIAKKYLFFQPEDEDKKCLYEQWLSFLENPEEEKPVYPTVPLIPEGKDYTIVSEWDWVDNYGKWMSIDGRVTSISKLFDGELVASVLAIRDANFTRVGKRIAWTKQLKESIRIDYPVNKLQVGYKQASDKLEEFREVWETRFSEK